MHAGGNAAVNPVPASSSGGNGNTKLALGLGIGLGGGLLLLAVLAGFAATTSNTVYRLGAVSGCMWGLAILPKSSWADISLLAVH